MAATVIITTLLQQQSTNTIFIIIGFVISAIFAFLLAYQMVRVSRWYGEKDRIIEEEDKKKEEIRQKGECVKKLKDLLSTDKTFGFYQILRHINKELDHDSMLLDLSTQCHVLSGINIETTYHYIPYILEKLQPFINIIADSKIEKKEIEGGDRDNTPKHHNMKEFQRNIRVNLERKEIQVPKKRFKEVEGIRRTRVVQGIEIYGKICVSGVLISILIGVFNWCFLDSDQLISSTLSLTSATGSAW